MFVERLYKGPYIIFFRHELASFDTEEIKQNQGVVMSDLAKIKGILISTGLDDGRLFDVKLYSNQAEFETFITQLESDPSLKESFVSTIFF